MRKPLLSLAVFAAFVALAGIAVAPARTWPAILLAGLYTSGVALGAGFFIAVHDASGATWIRNVRRHAAALTSLAPLGIVLLLAAMFFGNATLYPPVVGGGFKALWLAKPFLFARAAAYAALWLFFLLPASRGEGGAKRRMRGSAPLYIVVFAVTVSLSSVDFVMALDPAWSSTMFGVYRFAGLFSAAIAAVAVVAVRNGATRDEKHDLGKLLFAFSTFWMYIWFSQYMLIWYTNMPEESGYYALRERGAWSVVFVANVILNWIVPFFVLMSQKAKQSSTILSRVALCVLAGHALDLFVSIYPSANAVPSLSGWDAAVFLGAIAASLLLVSRALAPRAEEPTITLVVPPGHPPERQPVW